MAARLYALAESEEREWSLLAICNLRHHRHVAADPCAEALLFHLGMGIAVRQDTQQVGIVPLDGQFPPQLL